MKKLLLKIDNFTKLATDQMAEQISRIFANFNININPNTFSIIEVKDFWGKSVLQISFQIKESEFSNFWQSQVEIKRKVEDTLNSSVKFNPNRVND